MLVLYLVLLCCGALVLVSQSVQRAEYELAKVEAQSLALQEDIHVLKAEWQYLNAPQRLEVLAEQHLGLVRPDYAPKLPPSLSRVFVSPQNLPSPEPSPQKPVIKAQSPDADIPLNSSSFFQPVSYAVEGVR